MLFINKKNQFGGRRWRSHRRPPKGFRGEKIGFADFLSPETPLAE